MATTALNGRARGWAAVAAAFALAACQGSIGGGEDGTGAGGAGAATGGGASSGSGATGGGTDLPPEKVSFSCKDPGGAVELGATPMRRLSHAEYNNTIESLLGDASAPASGFSSKDPSLLGYDNNLTTLQLPLARAQDYLRGAEQVAARAVQNLSRIMPCTTQDEPCALRFIETFGAKAYRRPLEQADKDLLATVYRDARAAGDTFNTGIQLVLTAMLQMPQFLYRWEIGAGAPSGGAVKLTDYEVASRLSYLIWATMPDDALFTAAAAGQLQTQAQVLAQADRMLKDPKARRGLARFTEQWIPAASITPERPDLVKDTNVFRDWQPTYVTYLYNELARFIDHVTWNDGGKLETFLRAPYTFWDRNLNAYYRGTDAAARASDALVQVQQDPARYSGFLTKGGFLALEARPNDTRPVGRGVFVRERLLCLTVPPAPNDPKIDDAKKKLDVTDTAGLTQKERLGALIQDANCVSCHDLFNGLGLALENFDGVGRFRPAMANGKAIDPSGAFVGTEELDGPFTDHIDMIGKAAGSNLARTCFTKQVFRYAAGRAESELDSCTLKAIDDMGRASGYDVRQMVIGVVNSEGFLFRSGG